MSALILKGVVAWVVFVAVTFGVVETFTRWSNRCRHPEIIYAIVVFGVLLPALTGFGLLLADWVGVLIL